ncbi:Trm112 family protein [Paenalcaligenes faecalis]|uniref:Trm112 family protein n=1 Tax=Paenalcaligenes faecalis TaxID=2980099 RepID=UPI0022B97724|nr:Trm112 family protein [Paenalcaligenes faecalis]
MESHLLEVLVCPLCKSKLDHNREQQQLVCKADQLAFPIRDGIPLMLQSEAISLSSSET